VTRGNGITFRVGDPMTISLHAYGSGQYTITDTATHYVISQILTTLVIIP
jgi:hypothetical protein